MGQPGVASTAHLSTKLLEPQGSLLCPEAVRTPPLQAVWGDCPPGLRFLCLDTQGMRGLGGPGWGRSLLILRRSRGRGWGWAGLPGRSSCLWALPQPLLPSWAAPGMVDAIGSPTLMLRSLGTRRLSCQSLSGAPLPCPSASSVPGGHSPLGVFGARTGIPTQASCMAGRFFTNWAARETHTSWYLTPKITIKNRVKIWNTVRITEMWHGGFKLNPEVRDGWDRDQAETSAKLSRDHMASSALRWKAWHLRLPLFSVKQQKWHAGSTLTVRKKLSEGHKKGFLLIKKKGGGRKKEILLFDHFQNWLAMSRSSCFLVGVPWRGPEWVLRQGLQGPWLRGSVSGWTAVRTEGFWAYSSYHGPVQWSITQPLKRIHLNQF